MNLSFKDFSTTILCFIGLTMVSCTSGSVKKEVSDDIHHIAEKWAPDGREALFNVNAEKQKSGIVLHGETNLPGAKAELIELVSKPGLIVIDNIKVLPDSVSNEKYSGIVTLSVSNLRKEPDHASEMVSQAILGTPVRVLKNEDSWLLIQTPDKYIAWTEESSVKLMSGDEIKGWRNSEWIIYVENTGWIYKSPDESSVTGDIVAGSILQVTGRIKGYVKILLPDGREGYVRENEIMDFNTWKGLETNVEGVLEFAHTFLGSPYMWGGSSTKAVDCSGFVQSVYFNNRLILSRDASLQARHGEIVDLSSGYDKLKKGDLLFFGWKDNSGEPHVTHVAIFQGDNEYINSSGMVMINSLDSSDVNYSSYRRNSLLTARRIIGVSGDNGIVPISKHQWY